MKNLYLSFRILFPCACAAILVALFAYTPVSTVHAQRELSPTAPQIEAAQLSHAPAAPQATFESARLVHRVKYNNKWWMRIHVKFRIKNALSTPCKLYAYFYDDSDGEPLGAGDDMTYTTVEGNVYTGKDFTPSLNDAVYSDFQFYIPYEALNLETDPGSEYDLKYFLTIRDESTKKVFAKSGWYKFTLKY